METIAGTVPEPSSANGGNGMQGGMGGSFGGLSVASAPKFSGEGNFGRFLTDLDAFFAFSPSVNDEQRLRFLPLCLTGVARDAYDSLTDGQRTTFRDAVEGLKGLFHRADPVDAHTQLRALKFDRDQQSFDIFIIKFKKLVHEAYPGSVTDVVLFNSYIDALPERYKADVISQGITTFAGAVERTRNVMRGERVCTTQSPQNPAVRQLTSEPSALEQILNRLEQLERRMSDADRRSRDASGRAGPRRDRGTGRAREDAGGAASRCCFVCGAAGHLQRNCRFRNHTCFGCGETGHLAIRCPKARSDHVGNDQRGLAPGTRGPSDK